MKHHTELFEFLCELIDIQIKKYVNLPTLGIGPDALMNATLVLNETKELFEFADQLLDRMTQATDAQFFPSIFNQIRFYIAQEYLRGYAGWLLDENGIHTGLLSRVKLQEEQLQHIGSLAKIDTSAPAQPVNEIQKQCKHDSTEIASLILGIAKKFKENPELEINTPTLKHAASTLRKNAQIRYNVPEFADPIEKLHKECSDFLAQSKYKKSTRELTKQEAKEYETQDREKWHQLLTRYQTIAPDSKLFSPGHEWYKIGRAPKEKNSQHLISFSQNSMFFSGVAVLGAVALSMLITYFSQQSEPNVSPSAFH